MSAIMCEFGKVALEKSLTHRSIDTSRMIQLKLNPDLTLSKPERIQSILPSKYWDSNCKLLSCDLKRASEIVSCENSCGEVMMETRGTIASIEFSAINSIKMIIYSGNYKFCAITSASIFQNPRIGGEYCLILKRIRCYDQDVKALILKVRKAYERNNQSK